MARARAIWRRARWQPARTGGGDTFPGSISSSAAVAIVCGLMRGSAIVKQMAHSRTCDKGPGITPECVMRGTRNKNLADGLSYRGGRYCRFYSKSSGIIFSFLWGTCPMLDAWIRAEQYCDLAEVCLHLTVTSFSAQMRNCYRRNGGELQDTG
jgi:hypothetical protein